MSVTADSFEQRLRDNAQSALRNELNLGSHEKECAIRYSYIHDSIRAIKRDFRWAAVTGLSGMAAIIGFLVKLVFFP